MPGGKIRLPSGVSHTNKGRDRRTPHPNRTVFRHPQLARQGRGLARPHRPTRPAAGRADRASAHPDAAGDRPRHRPHGGRENLSAKARRPTPRTEGRNPEPVPHQPRVVDKTGAGDGGRRLAVAAPLHRPRNFGPAGRRPGVAGPPAALALPDAGCRAAAPAATAPRPTAKARAGQNGAKPRPEAAQQIRPTALCLRPALSPTPAKSGLSDAGVLARPYCYDIKTN